MVDIFPILKSEINAILQDVVKDSRKNLVAKGHSDTGELHNSIGARVEIARGELVGAVSFLMYGLAQDTGIKPSKIPFSSGSGAKRSKYIDALTAWVKRKGIETDARKAKGIAFGIAKKHKEFGMHTSGGKGNSRFDKSKQGWLSEVVEEKQSKIDSAIDIAVGDSLDLAISSLVNEANRNKGK